MISDLYVDAEAANEAETAAICSRLGLLPKIVPGPEEVYAAVAAAEDPIRRGKQVLYLTRNRGAFLKPCPGTRHYTCCGYQILHIGSFCTMDCSYCILQSYFHPPVLQFFVNHADLFEELEQVLTQPAIQRFGTGEFTDSLIWEACTDLSMRLIQKFAGQDSGVLELKTKTTAVAAFKRLPHNRRTILAWSLNTDRVIHNEERGTAPLHARLTAAASCADHGYPLAFHFDPVVIDDGCEAEYARVIERLFAVIDARCVAWISLGALRFMPGLKTIVQRRFPGSKAVYGDFITGRDGKVRYFKPLRMRLYRALAEAIRRQAPDVCVYLCMEDDEVWQEALGFRPADRGGLKRMLDEAAVRQCGLNPEGLRTR
jgi:spore photoproduct lyase